MNTPDTGPVDDGTIVTDRADDGFLASVLVEPEPGPAASPGWNRLLIATLARTVLYGLASLLLWAALPAAIGWHPSTVMSGSMEPRIAGGDVVVARPVASSDLKIGQVLLVHDPDHPGRLRFHRFVSVDATGDLVLKGDANPQPDSTHVPATSVVGVGVLRIPFVGLPIMWWAQRDWPALMALGLGVALAVALSMIDRRPRDGDPPPVTERRPRPRHRRRRRRLDTPLRRLTALTLSMGIVASISAGAGAAYAATTQNPASGFTTIPYYTCSASVLARSPYVYYRMADTTAIAADSSGNLRTGSYQSGSATALTTGFCPRDGTTGMTFTGAGTFIAALLTATMTNPSTFSIGIWFKTTTAGGRLIGFSNGNTGTSTSYDRMLYLNTSGAVVFGTYPGTVQTVTSATGMNNNVWHMAVGTLGPSGMVLYIDGVQVGTNASTGGQNFTGWWRVGWDNLNSWPGAPVNYSFFGGLAEAAVYTTVLTPAQVLAQYQAGT